jgi:N12 class adenine-specific DNA methylase
MKELFDYSLSYNNSCDIDFMAQVSSKPMKEMVDSLVDNKDVFFDTEKFDYVARSAYLSGDIRGKIDRLKEFSMSDVITNDYGFEIDINHNLQALINIRPKEVEIHDIDSQLSEYWIPAHIISDFAHTVLFPNLDDVNGLSIEFIPENGKWVLGSKDYLGFSDFDTDHKKAVDIFGAVLNSKAVIVKKTITNEHGTEVKVINQEATVVPNHIVDDFAKAFMSLYPQSDILVPPQGGLSKKNRLSFFERARMLNIDAIIIGHSAFKYLQVL